jgi:hypothetical protein
MSASRLESVSYPPLKLRVGASLWRRTRVVLIAYWRAPALDQQLALGASPRANAALALRAQRITSPRTRLRVADGLARALRDAGVAAPGISAAVRPDRGEVLAARIVLEALERRLRAPEAVTARGVAMLSALLSDGTSPLYRPGEPGELGSELRAAAAALEPGGP